MPGNVADAILALLAAKGIKHIFGVSGDAIFPLLDSLARQDTIKYYGTASEIGAAFMASYQAKLTGWPGVCIATAGPGTASLVNGLGDAYFDKAPVLVITGQVEQKKIGTKAKQYFHQQQLMRNVADKSELITTPSAVGPVLTEAFETAIVRGTVAHLSVPKDVLEAPAVDFPLPTLGNHSWSTVSGMTTAFEETTDLLKKSQRPVIIVGMQKKSIRREVLSLAEKIGAALIPAQQVKGAVPIEHDLVLTGLGEAYVPQVLNEADLILLLGDAGFDIGFFPKTAPIVQLAETTDVLHYGTIKVGVTGNIGLLLKLLFDRVSKVFKGNLSWREAIKKERSTARQAAQQMIDSCPGIHPAQLIEQMDKTLTSNAVITLDTGSFMHWVDFALNPRDRDILMSSHWRSIGLGIPAAIGACIAQPERQVIALTGDGGFIQSMSELLTAVKYKLPIKIVVIKNGVYALEKDRMQAHGMLPFGNNLQVPDCAAFAQACGAAGYKIKKTADLHPVLSEAIALDKPAVIEVEAADVPLPNL